jgi:hypothetical protein
MKNESLFSNRKLALLLGAALMWMGASGLSAQSTDKPAATEPGFTQIFNGKDLSGWDGDPKFWSVRDGAIVGQSTDKNRVEKNTFVIWTGGEVKDFVLRFDYRVTGNNPDKWGNSGVQYRAKRVDSKGWGLHGYQDDIDTPVFYTGILYEEGGRESSLSAANPPLWARIRSPKPSSRTKRQIWKPSATASRIKSVLKIGTAIRSGWKRSRIPPAV